jgi:membrane peptidoglycan carboxypeptidase
LNRIKKEQNINSNNNLDENQKFKPKKKKINLKLIFIILLILILFLAIKTGIYISTWQNLAQDMIANSPSSVIDTDGNEIAKIGTGKNTSNVSINNIPDNLKNAYISIEDQRFYKHCRS